MHMISFSYQRKDVDIMGRKYNYTDAKTNLQFYKTTKDGKTFYSRQFCTLLEKNSNWSPLFNTTKKVIDYIKEQQVIARADVIESYSEKKYTYRELFNMCFASVQKEYIKKNKSPRSLAKFHGDITNYVLNEKLPYKTIADKYVCDLSIQDIINFKNAINKTYSDSHAKSTISSVFSHIDKVFRFARNNNQMREIVFTEMQVKAEGKEQPSKQAVRNFLSYNEYIKVRKTYDEVAYDIFYQNQFRAHKHREYSKEYDNIAKFRVVLYRAFISFVFFTGSRKNEARGIRWRDLIQPTEDFDLFRMIIDKQYSEKCAKFVNKEVFTRGPKTDSSVRQCVIHEILMDDLIELMRFLKENGIYNEDEYIFTDFYVTNVKPIPEENLRRFFSNLIGETKIEKDSPLLNGIPRHITIHGMRHSACAYLLELGMDKRDVASFLGHKDTKMVDYVYDHFINPIDMEYEKLKRNLGYFRKVSNNSYQPRV